MKSKKYTIEPSALSNKRDYLKIVEEIKRLYKEELTHLSRGRRTDLHDPTAPRVKKRDEIAKAMGISNTTMSQLLYIDKHCPELLKDIPSQYSINGAYLCAKGDSTFCGLYVYDVAQCDDYNRPLYKIGLSSGIELRMKEAKTFNPLGKVIHTYECDKSKLSSYEAAVHRSLSAYSTSYSKEIFALSDDFDFDTHFKSLL